MIMRGMQEMELTRDQLQPAMAYGLIHNNLSDKARRAAMLLLANTGWTHVNRDTLTNFCAANGIDAELGPSELAEVA
jgi:hypothetical protein